MFFSNMFFSILRHTFILMTLVGTGGAQSACTSVKNFTAAAFAPDQLKNPGTGFFKWNGQEIAPVKGLDVYARFNWALIEKTQGVYDFSTITRGANEASTNPAGKGTFGFAFRAVVEGTARAYPAYLEGNMSAWYSNNKKCWVPDWNSPFFLQRMEALVNALGKQFDLDPRIGYVEIRTYGNWGEWHLFGFEAPPAPLTPITNSTIRRMIDAFVKAFPNKQIIMMSDNSDGLDYAMSLTNLKYPIGWRRDSWCNRQMDAIKRSVAWTRAQNRWMSAPVIVEAYGNTGMNSSLAVSQMWDYHISSIANGNFGVDWANLTSSAQSAYMASATSAGYRYVMQSVRYTNIAKAGSNVAVTSVWSNRGSAPTYYLWRPTIRILDGITRKVLISTQSTVDFRKLRNNTPVTVLDSVSLGSLPLGTYLIDFVVTHEYHWPMYLAIQGRGADGAYPIGSLQVVSYDCI
jgi:hypothetical protein